MQESLEGISLNLLFNFSVYSSLYLLFDYVTLAVSLYPVSLNEGDHGI